ncbi:MAG: serine/threonine protein kinase, partial [Myxococcales bacterium]|nr:serine/threonine protein kinase [Myxococcales bacterium]
DHGRAAEALPVDDPDRYRLVGEHARGGLGRVVRAHDTRLGRTVAVKELLKKSETAEALFVREALITARLQHPGIVPVIEAGRWPSGEPYYVMKLVEGRSLKELIAARPGLHKRLALLPSVIAVAEALGYAHSQGVIHRDVKPANVVVGEFGETVVVDWGLARDSQQAGPDDAEVTAGLVPSSGSVETVSGRVIGTPQYMSPEQATGEPVDARADVYSLGALLYEVLAGTAPYHGDSADAILQQVVDGPPPPLDSIQPEVPPDLLAIVTKAMDRDPAARYPTGRELAADLNRFATGQLVTAQQYSTIELVRRWIRRNRGVVAAALVSALLLVVLAAWAFWRVVEEAEVARVEGTRAEKARRAAEDRSNALRALQAESSVNRDPTATVAWLKQYPIAPDTTDAAATLFDEALAAGVARHVFSQDDWVYDVAFSPDGRLLTTGSKDGLLRTYDVATGAVRVLDHHDGGLAAVAFTADGRSIVAGGTDGKVLVWPAGGGSPRPLGELAGSIKRLELTAAGAVRAFSEGGDFGAWDLATGAQLARVRERQTMSGAIAAAVAPDDADTWIVSYQDGRLTHLHAGAPTGALPTLAHAARLLEFSPDGGRVALFDGEQVQVLDLATGKLRALGTAIEPVRFLTWSPDASQLAVGGDMHDLLLYRTDGADPAPRRELVGHSDAIYGCQFTRDGRRVLTASDDGTARVWDLVTGNAEVLRGHDDDVYRAVFSPDETLVATASLDGSARVWPVGTGAVRVLGGDADNVFALRLLDDHTALSISSPFQVRRWDLRTGDTTVVVPRGDPIYKIMQPAMSPRGDLAFPGKQLGEIDVARADGTTLTLRGHTKGASGGGFILGGDGLLSASHDGTVRRWDLATGTGRVLIQGAPIIAALVAPTGDRMLVVRDDAIELIDVDGKVLATAKARDLPPLDMVKALFSPDGATVLLNSMPGLTRWTPATGELVRMEPIGHHATNVAFSPDGTQLAAAMADRTVRLWDLATGKLTRTLRGHTDLVMNVAFSPDGQLLASTSYDRTIRVWNLAAGTSRVLRGHAAAVESVVWLDDGARLLTGGRDGTLRIWPTPPTRTPDPDQLRRRIAEATTAVIGPGERLATPTTL